jgi:hypothetical protein
MSYKSETQNKNIAWFLPRPKPDHYKGGMPLYAEEWLIELAQDILGHRKFVLLNLFCGMNKYGFRIDVNPEVNPDLLCDAHDFSKNITVPFNCILADPPYSNEESKELYGAGKLRYKEWTAECDNVLEVGGLLMIYHKYIMPNPFPGRYEVAKRVFIGNRTYHLLRACVIYRKIS